MKKKLLIILIIIIAIISSLLFIFKKEIDLLYTSYFASQEQIEQTAKKNTEELEATLEEKYSINKESFQVLSKEDEQALMSGEVSAEEIKEKIIEKLNESTPPKEDTPALKDNTKELQAKKCQEAVANAISEIYLVKTDYVAELGSLENTIKKYYGKLRREGQSKATAKINVAKTYTQTMVDFQNRCDASVNKILGDLEKVLKENNGDVSVIGQMRAEYDSIKKAKLNEYIARMKKS